MTSEFDTRLDDIRSGPWHAQSELARSALPQLSMRDQHRYLRSHFDDPIGIRDETEIKFRESFDRLLDELQLLELAVACGYLPLETVRPSAEAEFEAFLRPYVAAREYLETYDFVLVRFLAARLDIDLRLDPVTPPGVNSRAAVRFASFLAGYSEFAASPDIVTFTTLLDDFTLVGAVDAPFLRHHLESPAGGLTSTVEDTLTRAATGFIEFVQVLGDFFIQLDEDQHALFGCAYSYWLSHFFGLRRLDGRYESLGVSFEGVVPHASLFPPGLNEAGVSTERRRLADRVETLRQVWKRTRTLLDAPSA